MCSEPWGEIYTGHRSAMFHYTTINMFLNLESLSLSHRVIEIQGFGSKQIQRHPNQHRKPMRKTLTAVHTQWS